MYLGRSPLSGAFLKLDTLQPQFNSVLNTFPLTVSAESVSPGSAQNLIIVLNGVVQEPQASYNIDGSNIVFSFAVATGTPFFGVMLGHIGNVDITPQTNIDGGGSASIFLNSQLLDGGSANG